MRRAEIRPPPMFAAALVVAAFVSSIDVASVVSAVDVSSVVSADRRLLDGDEVFNRTLASKDGPNKFPRGARTPPTPPTRVVPSYSPPNRMSFTPPLPPQFAHPFENKPILRGSNSDSAGAPNRRPIPPPPFRMSPDELIPIRPPDLAPHDSKKKTLNTPSFKKVPADSAAYETSSTTTSNSRNETFDFMPVSPQLYPSISRILSGGNGRKPDSLQDIIERTRLEHDKEPRTIKQDKVKSLIPPVNNAPEKPPVEQPDERSEKTNEGRTNEDRTNDGRTNEERASEERTNEDKTNERPEKPDDYVSATSQPKWSDADDVEAAPQPERPEPRTRHVLGIAWDIHVYLVAVLFAMLALCSLINIIRLSYYKHLLSQGYFLSVHGILLIIGCMRSFYLFYDAYNIHEILPLPVSNLLLNMIFPLLTSAFAILFLFLLTATEVKAMNNRVQRVSILTIFIVLHLAASFAIHFYANDTPYELLLPLICQCVFIILCVGLGLAYLYLYKGLSQSCVQKASHMYCTEGERWSLAHAVRVTLATAMLSLLMAAVQLYGILGDYEVLNKDRQQPWLWWGFQLSVRVIEISMCALLAWAGMQRDSTALPEQPASVEDIYPTICTANTAYTMRSAKHYDDTFPLNSLHAHGGHPHHTHAHTLGSERRSMKKHPSLERRLQPSPSMLVAENGFVRFRTIADSELPDDTYNAAHSMHEFA